MISEMLRTLIIVLLFVISDIVTITTQGCSAFSVISPSLSLTSTTRRRRRRTTTTTTTTTNIITDTATTTATSITTLYAREKSKWDNLVDEDDSDDGNGNGEEYGFNSDIPVPSDMMYVERNVKRAHETFHDIRNIGGKEACHDVYAQSSTTRKSEGETMFYVGKVAKISDITIEDCIARQWNMIEHHSANLRPIELKPHRGRLELWIAPGDTELDVAYNRPELQMIKMKKYPLTNKELKNNLIGFQGEVYQEGDEGFRTWRTEDGYPARKEINEGGETRPPTDEEYEQLQKEVDLQKSIGLPVPGHGGETRLPTEEEMEELQKQVDLQNLPVGELDDNVEDS